MTREEKIFLIAYRIAESKHLKSGPVASEEEILADFVCVENLQPIARGQWCQIEWSESDKRELYKGLTYA